MGLLLGASCTLLPLVPSNRYNVTCRHQILAISCVARLEGPELLSRLHVVQKNEGSFYSDGMCELWLQNAKPMLDTSTYNFSLR